MEKERVLTTIIISALLFSAATGTQFIISCAANPYHSFLYNESPKRALRKTPIVDMRPKGKAGRKERYYDIVNHPKSYVLLCRKCNVKMDNKRRRRQKKT